MTLDRVTYTVDERPILKPTSFAIEPGEFIGVVGPSGAGKSTLCRLLIGVLKPSSGIVRLDGVDIATQSRSVLGPHVGYLPQHTGLFAGTVAENIARMAPDPDPEGVVAAAKAAGIHDLILLLPKGYDTPLGDDGAPLSAGQRQRIGLARTIYGDPRLVILDEPNAHLDGAGETALGQRADDAQGAAGDRGAGHPSPQHPASCRPCHGDRERRDRPDRSARRDPGRA